MDIVSWDELRSHPWEKLVQHRHCVADDATLVQVRNYFREHAIDFMAVIRGAKVIGLCSHKRVSEILSRGHHGLGFPIYERRPISDFMVEQDFRIQVNDAVHDVLDRLVERPPKNFFDDVIVLNDKQHYLGIITANDLVHFQYGILKEQQQLLQQSVLELRTLTHQLNESNEQLKMLNEEKNEFLGIAAHDLKNPINIINMSTELILTDDTIPIDQQHSLLRDVSHSCDRMTKLLGDLLDINRIENQKINYNLAPCDLEQCVLCMLDYFRLQAERKEQKIEYACDGDAPYLFVDESYLMQILENLISNAIKFSESGKTIQVTLSSNARQGRITIRDQGPGFSDRDKEKLFNKFARLSAKPTGNENSTGLGLSIVKRLTEGMGGSITLESTAGRGSTFTLSFPRTHPGE